MMFIDIILVKEKIKMIKMCKLSAVALAVLCAMPSAGLAQTKQDKIINNATEVLASVSGMPAKAIPEFLLKDASGVAIIPNVIRAGFIFGAQRGEGVLFVRREDKTWSPPAFLTIIGGSFGWQIGVESMDLILVFRNRRGIESLLKGSTTLGADASVAAGPLGRDATAATNLNLDASVFSYSQTRGLFVGLALNGAVMSIENAANCSYYQAQDITPQILFAGGNVRMPPAASDLVKQIYKWTRTPEPRPPAATEQQPAKEKSKEKTKPAAKKAS